MTQLQSRQRRYATHIRAAWNRLYPGSYTRFVADGTVFDLSNKAAATAMDRFASERTAGKPPLICYTAAAEAWALPPATGWELRRAIQVVIEHRWRRRWPELISQLDETAGMFAVEDIYAAIESAGLDEETWFDILPTILRTHGTLHSRLVEAHAAPGKDVLVTKKLTGGLNVERAKQLVREGLSPVAAIQQALLEASAPPQAPPSPQIPSPAARTERSDRRYPRVSAEEHDRAIERMLKRAAEKFGKK